MSKFPPAFQFYAADFLTATDEWTNEEVGVYIRLLCYQWVNGSIPGEKNRLKNIIKLSPNKLKKIWKIVGKKFEKLHQENDDNEIDYRLINLKLEEVRNEHIKYREQQAEYGRKGAAKRWPNRNPIQEPDEKPQTGFDSSSSSSSSSRELYTSIHIILKDGTNYFPDKEFIEEMKKIYSEIDIDSELKKMSAWCIANPKNRKTMRGIKKFINGWLLRSHDKVKNNNNSELGNYPELTWDKLHQESNE